MALRDMVYPLAEGPLIATRPTESALLMVSETRLREAMISLSEASLRMTSCPVGAGAHGGSGCWRSSSDGMVSSGDGGPAEGKAQEGARCGGGLGDRREVVRERGPIWDWVSTSGKGHRSTKGPDSEGMVTDCPSGELVGVRIPEMSAKIWGCV